MVHERQRRLGQDGSSRGPSEHVNVAVIELGTLRGIMMRQQPSHHPDAPHGFPRTEEAVKQNLKRLELIAFRHKLKVPFQSSGPSPFR